MNKDVETMIENINIFSKRLYLQLKYTNFKNMNLIEKSILIDSIKEQSYNINVETENIVNNI